MWSAGAHLPPGVRWLVAFVVFVGVTVALCGVLLGLRACRGSAEDRPRLPPVLAPPP